MKYFKNGISLNCVTENGIIVVEPSLQSIRLESPEILRTLRMIPDFDHEPNIPITKNEFIQAYEQVQGKIKL